MTSGVTDSDLPYYGTTARTRATLPEPEIEESPLVPPEPPEVTFTGFDLSEIGETPKLGNIASNICNRVYSGIVCPDYERGCAYITAVGYDNKFHKFIDGKDSGVLADCTAWALNIWDGMLYCLIDSDNDTFLMQYDSYGYSGDIYRIDPDTGSAELMLQADAVDLAVADGMLYYTVKKTAEGGPVTYETYRCEIDGSGCVPLGVHIIGFCGRYYAVNDWERGGYGCFYDPETGELIPFTEKRRLSAFMLCDNGKAYYSYGASELDITTGEERELSEAYNKGDNYVKLGDDVYTAMKAAIITHIEYPRDKTTKFWSYCETPAVIKANEMMLKGGYPGFYSTMFTDGEKIYAIEANALAGTAVMLELIYDPENRKCEANYIL